MTKEQREAFKAENDRYYSISKQRAEFIKTSYSEYEQFTINNEIWHSNGYEDVFDISLFEAGWDQMIMDSYCKGERGLVHPDSEYDNVHKELERDRTKLEFSLLD